MDIVLHILATLWSVVVMMAPYLMIGFGVAGLASVLLTPGWVARHFGKQGNWPVIKSALLGVPLPLCSCGVLPLAFSLRRDGASAGSTVSFLASTPQTGVDSIMLTYSLLGPIFATTRVLAAFLSGVLAGLLTTNCCKEENTPHPAKTVEAGKRDHPPGTLTPGTRLLNATKKALHHGFVTLPRGMARPLLVGVVLSGLIAGLVPDGFFSEVLPSGFISYMAALLIGIPLYVCSAASVPVAAGLLHMGTSPGTVIIFLIAGPATNAAAIATMWREVGKLATTFYLGAIAVVALSSGLLLDYGFTALRETIPVMRITGGDCHDTTSAWNFILAVLLLLILIPGLWKKSKRT